LLLSEVVYYKAIILKKEKDWPAVRDEVKSVKPVKREARRGGFISEVTVTLVAAGLALLMAVAPAVAQPVQDSLMSKEEQARSLEREISSLEARLAGVQHDPVSIARRLSEIERLILECYVEIDTAEAEVVSARQTLNNRFRALYVTGREDTLVRLLNSRNVTDFLVWSEYVMDIASMETDSFKALKEKRTHLRDCQQKLEAFRKEQARLNETADTAAIEAQIAQKKNALADVNATLIAMQLPGTYTPAPETFNPGRVYARPDDNGFNRSGQMFSGYSSWYGGNSQGKPTASGEVFDQYAFACAHRTLPFGTYLRVTFLGRSVIVKVNDRGPLVKGRILDLSRGAAEAIGLSGVQWVDCEIVVPQS
jgi:rare lipoprotein A (peptidoglycan hydrolase)